MNNLPFRFPVLRIPEPNNSLRESEYLGVHCERSDFTIGSEEHIRGDFYVGHLIFDALGRTWRLNALTNLGFKARPFWSRILGPVFGLSDIRYELSEELGMSFADVKEQLLMEVAAKGDIYSRGEYAKEVFDASKSNEELLDEFVMQVRNSERPLELIAVVYFHDFV
jgi:hypothetical protein